MGIRRNVVLSFVIHASLLTAAAGFITGRDAVFRVPEKIITIVLFENITKDRPASAPIKNTGADTSIPPAATKKGEEQDPPRLRVITERKSFLPPQTGEKNEIPADSEGRKAAVLDNAKVILRPESSGKGNASGENPTASLTEGSAARDEGMHGTSKAAEGNTGIISTIRAAIERAKSYPALAKKRGIEGTVTAEFRINSRGMPDEIRITKSSGYSLLDNAAKETIIRAAPLPSVTGNIEIPITFRLTRD